MSHVVRSLSLLVASVMLVSACGLVPLPEPVGIDTAFGFGDGIAVNLTADAGPSAAVMPAALATSFSGAFNQTFVVEAADIPPILKTLVRIKGVSETITLDTAITVANPVATDFPVAFTVSDASISGLQLYRGTSKIAGPLGFTGIGDASIEYLRLGACSGTLTCTYNAPILVDLLELSVSGGTASTIAKSIADGGTFRVEGTFGIAVDPGLPATATVAAVILGTGAYVE
jgi:hypothetical protein